MLWIKIKQIKIFEKQFLFTYLTNKNGFNAFKHKCDEDLKYK